MSYIGTAPTIGNFQVCDAISVVNGQASYTMQVSGVNATPQSANHMLVSLNGILQAPNSSFTVSGSTITFASNLVTGDVIDFIQILGDVLDLGVPSDNTVSLAKLTATGTKDATTFLRGDNTFAEAGGGKILQVVEDLQDTEFQTTSTSFVTTGLSLNITPSSTSSKILIIASPTLDNKTSTQYIYTTIYRDSTNLAVGTEGMQIFHISDGSRMYGGVPLMKLDSPNTTSQVTYAVYLRTSGGTARLGQNNMRNSIVAMEVSA